MRPEEYDVEELRRLMTKANELHDGIEDVDPPGMTADEQEALYDARYYAHKLFNLTFRLAKAADEAHRKGSDDGHDMLGVAAPPGWFGNR